jgi:hypothetical protein
MMDVHRCDLVGPECQPLVGASTRAEQTQTLSEVEEARASAVLVEVLDGR